MTGFTIFNNEPDVRTWTAGEVIFAEGQSGDLMFAVLDGEVDIRRQERHLATITPGGVFGEMALIDHGPRSASAIARTDARVAAITDRRITLLISQNPRFALEMMRVLVERARHNLET